MVERRALLDAVLLCRRRLGSFHVLLVVVVIVLIAATVATRARDRDVVCHDKAVLARVGAFALAVALLGLVVDKGAAPASSGALAVRVARVLGYAAGTRGGKCGNVGAVVRDVAVVRLVDDRLLRGGRLLGLLERRALGDRSEVSRGRSARQRASENRP
jgi:hypothetical protein